MKPLTKKQRSLSIGILGFVFIVLAPIIIFYSFGYRFDNEFAFQKTGGIFVHSTISNVSVFLNDEYVKDNGLFARNVLIQDLTPNEVYTIRIQKDGYQSWIKNVFVYPSIVSETRILMLPNEYVIKEILPYIVDGEATDIAPTKTTKPNNEQFLEVVSLFKPIVEKTPIKAPVISKTTNSTEQIEELEVTKTKLDLFFESIKIEDQTTLKNLIINDKEVSWLTDSGIVLYWTDTETIAPYYYCESIERDCKTMATLNWSDITRFDYFPGRNDVWVVATKDGIYAVEVDQRSQRNVQAIYKGRDVDFRLSAGGRLIVKDGANYFEINL